MRSMMHTTGFCLAFASAMMLQSCSVSVGLTSGEILEELDELIQIDNSDDSDRKIRYAQHALVSKWYMHNALLIPVRTPAAWLFGQRQERWIENPAKHVQELLIRLPQKTGDNLQVNAAAASRLGWLAELDRNAQTRIIAIDGLSRISRQLALKPFDGSFANLNTPIAADTLTKARNDLRTWQTSARSGEGSGLESYRDALAQISSAPLPRWDERLMLIEDLNTGDIKIQKDKMGGRSYEEGSYEVIEDRSVLEYRKGETGVKDEGMETQKSFKEADEYEEYKVEFDADGTEADATDLDAIVQKEIIEEAGGDAPSIKKAGGGIARMLGE